MSVTRPVRPAQRWRLPASLRDLRTLLRNRPDTEHELTTNRLLLASGIIIYLVVASAFGSDAAVAALDVAALPVSIFALFAACLFVHILLVPDVCHYRRVAGIVADVGTFSYGLHVSGEAGAGLFLVYFWAVLGNGFRFGVVYLALAAVAAVSGFVAVILSTTYWQEETNLSIGLIGALIVIPAYTAKLIRKLSQAKREAEQASQAKSLFLASMSHELRTPLNAIIGLSDLLLGMSLKGEHKDMVRTISRSGRSLLSLIEAVLDLSRIEAGQVKIQLERVDLPSLLKDVRAIAGVAAHAKGLRLALHMSGETPRFILADRRHLEEILLNLASNAVKFTAHGHVRIDVGFCETERGTALQVEVSDTGIGIDPAAHGRIFERFTQADGTILDRFGGTGLGLAIVRQLVRAMGGEIGVVSAPGEGSTFHFSLPVEAVAVDEVDVALPSFVHFGAGSLPAPAFAAAEQVDSLEDGLACLARLRRCGVGQPLVLIDAQMRDPSSARLAARLLDAVPPEDAPLLVLVAPHSETVRLTPAMRDLFFTAIDPEAPANLSVLAAMADGPGDRASEAITPRGTMRRLKLLIADDNKTNQMVLGKILETGGHAYEVVENGEAAVERMLQGDLDLVLMDVNMPVMNGIEATKFYRFAALGMKEIPIIAVTADATGEARERCLEAGMAECLTKPLEPRRLLEAIEAVLGETEAEETSPAVPAELSAPAIADRPVIDMATCEALEQLGGADFVDQLLEQFVNDSVEALKALSHAVAEENVQGFRNSAHALRSAAANVGAARIYQLCLEWREINDPELAQQGELHLQTLTSEFERLQQEVRTRLAS
ncbi:two-component system, sensor histidine kinase RpfC [Rhizobium sp. RU35A]|uniref:ATP-binding protein n=1 Tax=Rhizobium sp. RU35A TaxID=1907414 RepID=UPI000956C1F8|nr:ATP-binding protein [Rhizobium sp. RU35A]SIR21619.1 two-component system, sensor histidine kinase RpfC [Rhizobium sp. RU35A]